MACYITGIAPTSDIDVLEEMLGAVGEIDRAKLTIITPAEETQEHRESFLNFIHAGEGSSIDSAGRGVAGSRGGMMTGFGGTGVPGITSGTSNLGFLGTPGITRQLGTLPIPVDEVGNYNDALGNGRSVIAYECSGDDRSRLEAAFRSAGIRHVKTFS